MNDPLNIFIINIILFKVPSDNEQFPVLGGLIKEYTESNQ